MLQQEISSALMNAGRILCRRVSSDGMATCETRHKGRACFANRSDFFDGPGWDGDMIALDRNWLGILILQRNFNPPLLWSHMSHRPHRSCRCNLLHGNRRFYSIVISVSVASTAQLVIFGNWDVNYLFLTGSRILRSSCIT